MADEPTTFDERFNAAALPSDTLPSTEMFGTPEAMQVAVPRALKAIFGGLSGYNLLEYFGAETKEAVQKGLTPEREAALGQAGALATVGTAAKFATPAGLSRLAGDFHEQVLQPAAERAVANPATVEKPLGADVQPNIPRSQLAQTGEAHIDSVINHPALKNVIDNPIIDREHEVPNSWGGSLPIDNPVTYVDKDFPRALSVDGVTFDPADGAVVHENVEEMVITRLMKSGMDRDAALRAAYWGWGNPAEHAWYREHGMDPDHVEAALKPYLDAIAARKANPANIPDDLFKETYPDGDALKAAPGAPDKPSEQEASRARAIMAQPETALPEPTARKPVVNPLQQARELGVIGGERPDLIGVPPKEAARRAMAAGRTPGERIVQEAEGPSPWRQRFERTLNKMETPADARRVIEAIVDKNDEFQAARQGDLSPTQIEQLGLVGGLDTTKIDVGATSAKIKNDAQIRNIIESFTSLNGKIKEAADAVRAKNGVGDDAEVAELQRLELQHDLLLDATVSTKEFVALRAEFGRIGNTIQDFMKTIKDANAMRDFMRDRLGTNFEDIRNRARLISETDDRALPRVLNPTARNQPKHWFSTLWRNYLISGLITHSKYAIVNTAQTALNQVFAPLTAAVIDRAMGRDTSLLAPVWSYQAMVNSFPNTLRGAYAALKAGERIPTITEMELLARGEDSPAGPPTPYDTSNKINWGIWKRVFNEDQLAKGARAIELPSRSANAMHTLYRFLNTEGSMGRQAFQAAFAEKPASNTEFWQRYEYWRANPTDEMLRTGTAEGYDGTFMAKMGPATTRLLGALKNNPITQWIFPFVHIPEEIARTAVRYSPLAYFGPEMRAQLTGERGQPAQSLAVAKVVLGTSALAYFVAQGIEGKLTGSYPIEQKERNRWRDLGIQPNSVVADEQYHSIERLGPPGLTIGFAGDLAHIWQHYDVNDEKANGKAVAGVAIALANMLVNDVGFQSIKNVVEMLEGQQSPERFLSYEASTLFIPSLIRQQASIQDPYMREVSSIIDGLKYALPFAREGLRPKLDPLYGEPLPNPGYGTIGRNAPVNKDFAKQELDRIGYYPAAPAKHIGGVQLNAEQYYRYQATAGPLVKQALDEMVRDPDWSRLSQAEQRKMAKDTISWARKGARDAMQIDRPQLILDGNARQLGQINGTQ